MKRETKNDIYFVVLVVLCVAIALLLVTYPNHRQNLELYGERAALQREIRQIQEQNERFAMELAALKDDPFYIEAVGRMKFRLIAPGEKLVESVSEAGK